MGVQYREGKPATELLTPVNFKPKTCDVEDGSRGMVLLSHRRIGRFRQLRLL